jgi:hypothetical protein
MAYRMVSERKWKQTDISFQHQPWGLLYSFVVFLSGSMNQHCPGLDLALLYPFTMQTF